jgi:hypothetical protein
MLKLGNNAKNNFSNLFLFGLKYFIFLKLTKFKHSKKKINYFNKIFILSNLDILKKYLKNSFKFISFFFQQDLLFFIKIRFYESFILKRKILKNDFN